MKLKSTEEEQPLSLNMKFKIKIKILFSLVIVFFIFSVIPLVKAQEEPPPIEEKDIPPEEDEKIPLFEDKFGSPDGQNEDQTNQDQTPGSPTDGISFDTADVEIRDFVEQISRAMGINFIMEPKLSGKITIITEKKMTVEEAYQAFLSALEVMGYTILKSPSGLYKIVKTANAKKLPLEIFREDTPFEDRFVTRIIQVNKISANKLATVIKDLISKDGNLFAYPDTNTLIITDTGANIDRILQIVKELDQEGPQETIEIIAVQNADATDIAQKVQELFQKEETGTTSRRRRTSGEELEEAPTVTKILADERTNSVIVLGTKRGILEVRLLISKLDSALYGEEGTIHVYYLNHANAEELSSVLSALVADAETKAATKKGEEKKAGAVQLEGGVKVTHDTATNSLVITGSTKDYETLVNTVIRKLDIPRLQVYLEAVVMELSVDKTKTLGFAGNFGGLFNIAGNQFTGFGSILPIAPSFISSIASAAGGFAGGAFSNSVINFTLSDGTEVSVPAASAILQALQTDTDVNILSTPSILTMDNEKATLTVGQEVPVPTGTTVSTGSTTFSITREDTGIILEITPQINEKSSRVQLEINQQITDVVSTDTSLGPTLTKREISTLVVAEDKQTIVIGGLIDDKQTVTTNKVPLLGDIPVIGNLFKNRTSQKQKTNILVFVTPYIIRDRSDYLKILQAKIEERNLFIDLNYGTSQRKQIREAIQNHATELLDYKYVGGETVTQSSTEGSGYSYESPSQVTTSGTSSDSTSSSSTSSTSSSSPGTYTTSPPPPTTSSTTATETPSGSTTTSTVTTSPSSSEEEGSSNFGPPSRRVKQKSRN